MRLHAFFDTKLIITALLVAVIVTGILPFGMTPLRKIIPKASAQAATSVSVSPPSIVDTGLVPGSKFTVDINIADVTDLFAWGLRLSWDPALLNTTGTDVVEGPFLQGQPEGTGFVKKVYNLEGYVDLACTTMGEHPGVSGSGTLVSITFTVRDVGECALDIQYDELLDHLLKKIPHQEVDGYFKNGEAAPDFSISASPTSLTIAQGSSGTSTITLTSLNAFTGSISLSVSGAITGITATLSPASVTLISGGTATSTLTITVSIPTTTAPLFLTVTGSGGGKTHTTHIDLTVPLPAASVKVRPATIIDSNLVPGSKFTVDINIDDVTDLFSWALRLYWDPALLNTTIADIVEGPFLQGQPEGTAFVKKVYNLEGYVDIACTTIGDYPGVSGSGTLVSITFTVRDVGECRLDIQGSKLLDHFLNEIPHGESDGYFKNVVAGPDFSISASPTSLTIPQASLDTSTITLTSLSGFTGSVSLSVSGAPTGVTAALWPTLVTLASGGSATSTLTVSVSASAATGSSTLTVTGTGGGKTHTVSIDLTVPLPATSVSVSPPSIVDTGLVPGSKFTIDINIADVTDLFGWALRLYWDPALLNTTGTDVVEGPFLKDQPEGTAFVKRIHNLEGYVDIGCTTMGDHPGVSGSGTLVSITFTVRDVGECALDIQYDELIDHLIKKIPHQEADGYFKNGEVANFSMSASPTSLTIAQGSSGTSIIALTSLYAFTESISLSVWGAPTGVTATLSPDSVTLISGGTATSTLTITVSASAPTGESILMVTGSGGGKTHTMHIDLTVTKGPPPATSVSVSPPSIIDFGLVPGSKFTVDINVADVTDLFSWGVVLYWDPALLNTTGTDVVEGPFLKDQPEGTIFVRVIHNDEGYVDIGCATLGEYPGVSGSGTLVSITFTVRDVGECALDIQYSELRNRLHEKIPHEESDGYFKNGEVAPDFSLWASPLILVIVQGGSDMSTITVTSIGSFNSAVALTVSGAPTGVTATLSPESVTPPAGGTAISTLTFSVSTSAAIGERTLTITGTSGALTHSRTISLTILSLPHDVAVTDVEPSPSSVIIGDPVTVTVTVENQGGLTETFTVTAFYDNTAISTQTVTDLPAKESTTLTFIWTTTGVPVGDYTIKAEASIVPEEHDVSDNTFIDGKITIAYRKLTIKLTGEFDYLRMETVKLRLAALVEDAETMELVSGAVVNAEIYDAAGGLWISEQMLEKIPGSGVYEWMSTDTIAQLRLVKGVYLVRASASFRDGPAAHDLLMFHIDPPPEGNSESLYYIAFTVIALVGATGLVLKRRQIASRLGRLNVHVKRH